jgi:hypothetical protein
MDGHLERIGYRYTSPNCHQYDFHFLCSRWSFRRTVLTPDGGRYVIDIARQAVLEMFPVQTGSWPPRWTVASYTLSKDNMIAAISAAMNMCRLR